MAKQEYGYCPLGVDYSQPPHQLPDGALADGRNVYPNSGGLITGRKGSVRLNSTSLAAAVLSVFEYRSGATRNQLCNYSTKVAVYDSGTGDFVDKIVGLTNGKMYQWVNFAGKAIGVNEGSDAPQYWTDDANKGVLAGSPPSGVTVAEWANRLWFGGDAAEVARLTGSVLNDPTDYTIATTATAAIQAFVGDKGDKITGVFPFFDSLLVGKLNNIYRVTGDPPTDQTTLAIKPLYTGNDNAGFTSPWAITQVGNDVVFQDGFDIKALSGIQEYGDVEYTSIIPHFRGYLESIADKDYLQYTQFFHYKQNKQIWVSIPTSATARFVFVLDYQFYPQTKRYAVFPMYGVTVRSFGGFEDGEVANMYFGDGTGYVSQLDTGNDDSGTAIERYFVQMASANKIYNNRMYDQRANHEWRKQFNDIDAYFYSEQAALSMTPYYATDLMDPEQVRTSGNYTALTAETVTGWQGAGIKHKRLRLFGINGKTLALKWRHNTVAQNFVCYPSSINFAIKSRNHLY